MHSLVSVDSTGDMKDSPSQLHNEIEELKHILSAENLNEKEQWKKRQELCYSLESLLLMDLDFALDKKGEQDLWGFVFRNPIAACQLKAKEQKKSNKCYSSSQLTILLENASGFYLQLLQKLCCAYNIDLPCHPKDVFYGLTREWVNQYQVLHQPRHSSLFYICQHCLVHLGDVARYRGQSLQAENFYRHAVDLVPSNGQPYNQLALLEAASGEKLSTVFFYIRSLSVQHPFPLAATNLQNLFLKMSSDGNLLDAKEKMSLFEYSSMFLKFHAVMHVHGDVDKARSMAQSLSAALPALIIAEKFETWQLVQMVAVCLFSVVAFSTNDPDKEKLTLQPSGDHCFDEKKGVSCVMELIDGMLYAFLLPLHASPDPKETAMYYTLPAVKIILDWLLQDPEIWIQSTLFKEPKIWHALCKLMNDLTFVCADYSTLFDVLEFEGFPLPEDWDLQCFLPLKKSQRQMKFRMNTKTLSDKESIWLRSVRLCEYGTDLSSEGKLSLNLLSVSEKDNCRHFQPLCSTDSISALVMKEIQDLTMMPDSLAFASQICEQTPSKNVQSSENASQFLWPKTSQSDVTQQEVRFKLDEVPHRKEIYDGERENKIEKRNKDMQLYALQERRLGKNVAMQAILQQHAASGNMLISSPKDFGAEAAMIHSKNTVKQDVNFCPQSRLSNFIENPCQMSSSLEGKCVAPPLVQDVNLTNGSILHFPEENYASYPTQKPSLKLGNGELEAWIQQLNLQQDEIPTPVNCVSSKNNYMQNTMQHVIPMNTPIQLPNNYQNQKPPKLQFPQQHIINKKSLPSAQPMFVTDSPEKMWNYMNIIASYHQPCSGNGLPPSNQMPVSNGTCQQKVNGPKSHIPSQQLTNGYYYMNHSKAPPSDASVQRNVRQHGTPCEMNILPHQNYNGFQNGFHELSSPSSIPSNNLWQQGSSHTHEAMPNRFSSTQVISRPNVHSVHNSAPPHVQEANNKMLNGSHDELNTYSLFNSPWPSGLIANKGSHQCGAGDTISDRQVSNIQSLWENSGVSPLEQLLEQQKNRRDKPVI